MTVLRTNNPSAARFREQGWWGDITLRQLFDSAVDTWPAQLALADPPNRADLAAGEPRRLSFAALAGEVDRMTGCLLDAGLTRGDRLVLQMPNTVEIVIAYLSAARLGLVVSPVAMQYRAHEMRHVFDVIRPDGYLVFASFANSDDFAATRRDLPPDCTLIALPDSGELTADAVTRHDTRLSIEDESADDIFTICWTSGTTGRPKGVPRSHNHWLASTLASADAVGIEPGDALLNPFPFINMAAIGGFLYLWLQTGARLVLHHPFDPMLYLTQLQEEGITYTVAPPAVLNMLLQQKDTLLAKFDLSKLRRIGSGSAPLAPAMVRGFSDDIGIEVMNIFGSNEGMALISSAADVPDAAQRALYFPRFGTPGLTWRNRAGNRIRTRLVDTDTGKTIDTPGTAGEMLISGPTVFDGYFESPDDNAEAFSDSGEFRTGDLFEIAGDDGRFYKFVGRCKELIVRGGVNISPEELDLVLMRHPSIQEAAACGYADDILGERTCAVCVLKPGESLNLDDLIAHFEACEVARHKWPERLHLIDALPRNAMNKVVRQRLTELVENA